MKRSDDLIPEQMSASHGRTDHAGGVKELRQELRDDHMYPIAKRGADLMTWSPEGERALRMPHPSMGSKRLVDAANAMAKAIDEDAEELFISEACFPRDFLEKLRAATLALHLRVAAEKNAPTRLREASEGLEREISRGRRLLDSLNGLLKPLMRKDKQFAYHWQRKRRLPAKPGRPRSKGKHSPELRREKIVLAALDPAVRAELKKTARRGKITRLVALMRDEQIEGYAVSVRRRASRTRILVGPDGRVKSKGE